jgi:hypothetical protein
MSNILHRYLADDHDRLDDLLKHAVESRPPVAAEVYDEFRTGLLRHISIEEKIVFPTVSRLQGGKADPVIARLRLDHGAIVALLVASPSPSVVATLSSILAAHNALEEQADGVYEMIEIVAGTDLRSLLERCQSVSEVPVHPTKPLSQVIDAIRRAVARAGHTFIDTEDEHPS